MTITFAEQSAITVSTTPISLLNGNSSIATNTTKALVQVIIDTTNVTSAADFFEVKLLEKVISGGTQRSISLGIIDATQNGPFITPAFFLGNGWDFSITKTGGTDRAFDWSVREVN